MAAARPGAPLAAATVTDSTDEAMTAGRPVTRIETTVLDPAAPYAERAEQAQRASRGVVRRATHIRAAGTPRRATALLALRTVRAAQQSASREASHLRAAVERRTAQARRIAARALRVDQARSARPAARHRVTRSVVTKHATVRHGRRVMSVGNGMTAVIAYARSQIGKAYVTGGEGPGGFDCSGFTKRAYARAGLALPHSSGAQAARARFISRSAARPGDLVVGPGHVGIYMGRGMMIDAGNHRTGVVYRKLYSGLRVARF
jgi:cell wall-associated NlpC family hydrolase